MVRLQTCNFAKNTYMKAKGEKDVYPDRRHA
jgi:hypothetical protein